MPVREMPRRRAALLPPMRGALLLFVVACSGSKVEQRAPASPDLELGGLGGTKHATPPPADAAVAVTPPPAPNAPPAPSGLDFATEVQLLYRIAACGGPDPGRVPSTF